MNAADAISLLDAWKSGHPARAWKLISAAHPASVVLVLYCEDCHRVVSGHDSAHALTNGAIEAIESSTPAERRA